MAEIMRILPPLVPLVWPKVEAFIAAAVDRAPFRTYEASDIRPLCERDERQLWVAIHEREIVAAVVTHLIVFPRMKVCSVPYIGGRRLKTWLHEMHAALEGFARAEGCDAMWGSTRRGWARLPGWRSVDTVELVKELPAHG